MMDKYFSRSDKEGFMQGLVANQILYDCKECRKVFQPYKKELDEAYEKVQEVLRHIGDDINKEVGRALMNIAKNSTIRIAPKQAATGEPVMSLVVRESLNELLGETTMNCLLCDKKKVEAKQCRTRKLLLDCMIYGDDTQRNCPYQGVIE